MIGIDKRTLHRDYRGTLKLLPPKPARVAGFFVSGPARECGAP